MPRKSRPLERDREIVRDATLIVIASEDTHAAKKYFDAFRAKRLQFKVLPTGDGESSPEHLLKRLDRFRSEYAIEDDDQLWYCGDTDRWIRPGHIQNLTLVIQQCGQKGYQVALSRPCFEYWLLLHFEEPSFNPDAVCNLVSERLRSLAFGYSKQSGCRRLITAAMVSDAVDRAKNNPAVRQVIPGAPASQIYLIIEELMKRQAIVLCVEDQAAMPPSSA